MNEINVVPPPEKSNNTIGRPSSYPVWKSSRWHPLCPNNRMPMEDASRRVRVWLYLFVIGDFRMDIIKSISKAMG